MKTCKNCGQEKPVEAFGKDSANKDRLTRWCRQCRNDVQRVRQREFITPEKQRQYALKYQYGITPEHFDEMLATQDGKCAVCPATEDFCVDHDHSCCPGIRSCGKCIRGILCRSCNVTLGLVNDDPERLNKLSNYLRKQ